MEEVLEMHALHRPEMCEGTIPDKGMELAEAYVRDQPLDCIYPPEEGLKRGTVFPNLSKPYKGWINIPECGVAAWKE